MNNDNTKMNQPEQSRDITALVNALKIRRARYGKAACLSLDEIGEAVARTLGLLFPHHDQNPHGDQELANTLALVLKDWKHLIATASGKKSDDPSIISLTEQFVTGLPAIADVCHQDAEALLENDPAAVSLDEIILGYPGFFATSVYRLAHSLLKMDVPLLPRLMTEYAHNKTGIDIHPGAQIGLRFFVDHGTGVVIGGTAVIGNNVKIYQGVTLGALKVDRKDRDAKRHPTIEDNVVVYANATLLGGKTIVGANSIIGGNVWLTRSVPAWSRVMFRACDTEEIIPIEARKGA